MLGAPPPQAFSEFLLSGPPSSSSPPSSTAETEMCPLWAFFGELRDPECSVYPIGPFEVSLVGNLPTLLTTPAAFCPHWALRLSLVSCEAHLPPSSAYWLAVQNLILRKALLHSAQTCGMVQWTHVQYVRAGGRVGQPGPYPIPCHPSCGPLLSPPQQLHWPFSPAPLPQDRPPSCLR